MARVDFAAINARLSAEDVRRWLPDGKRRGREWVAPNPTRADGRAGSFSVNMESGAWADFATGDRGGDLVSLYAYLYHGGDQGAAARALGDDEEIPQRPQVARLDDRRPKIVMPVPADAPAPPLPDDATAVWRYASSTGETLLYVVRHDRPGQRKSIRPLAFTDQGWQWRGITGDAPRPLYGLDRLAARPDAPVLIVEGEKAADAAQRLLGESHVVLAWLGGTSTAAKVDLRRLDGRDTPIYLWPDADDQRDTSITDQPGMAAMRTVARRLPGSRIVGYTLGERPHGWDLADAEAEGWTRARVLAEIAERSADPADVAQLAPPTPIGDACDPSVFPDWSEGRSPRLLGTIANYRAMLGAYGIAARYNEIAKRIEVTIPGQSPTVDNAGEVAIAEVLSCCARNGLPKGDASTFVARIADENAYSPIREWIDSRAWDGVSRLDELNATVHVAGDTWLRDRVILRWMLSCVAAVYEPEGIVSHGALVFQGPQGIGKTSWVTRLVPESLRAVLVGATLDPDNKDSVIRAISHWIVELGELESTFRREIGRIKAFITTRVDTVRQPYARTASTYPRRTVFFASVNESQFLVDDTGNRRWWTLPVVSVDYDHTIDVQQVWAEVLALYRAGAQWHLTQEEQAMIDASNEGHRVVDPIEEMICARYVAHATSAPPIGTEWMTATAVLEGCGVQSPRRGDATRASAVLRRLAGEDPRKTGSGRVFAVTRRSVRVDDRDDAPF